MAEHTSQLFIYREARSICSISLAIHRLCILDCDRRLTNCIHWCMKVVTWRHALVGFGQRIIQWDEQRTGGWLKINAWTVQRDGVGYRSFLLLIKPTNSAFISQFLFSAMSSFNNIDLFIIYTFLAWHNALFCWTLSRV